MHRAFDDRDEVARVARRSGRSRRRVSGASPKTNDALCLNPHGQPVASGRMPIDRRHRRQCRADGVARGASVRRAACVRVDRRTRGPASHSRHRPEVPADVFHRVGPIPGSGPRAPATCSFCTIDSSSSTSKSSVALGGITPARAARAVAHRRRNREHARAADLHAGDALVPALDDFAGAEPELERRAAVLRAVELAALL